MTIDPPDFDEQLEGCSAVILQEDGKPVCHGVISAYPDGEYQKQTECGEVLSDEHIGFRSEFVESGHEMCPDCWPKQIVKDTGG